MWGQTGRTPFLYATEPNEKLVNVPSVPVFPGLLGGISDSDNYSEVNLETGRERTLFSIRIEP